MEAIVHAGASATLCKRANALVDVYCRHLLQRCIANLLAETCVVAKMRQHKYVHRSSAQLQATPVGVSGNVIHKMRTLDAYFVYNN